MSALAPIEDAGALVAALPVEDAGAVARARAEAVRRPIEYPFGSGHADEAALFAGIKPVLRQLLDAGDLEAARARFEARGLAVALVARTPASPTRSALFAGRDRARVEAAAACEPHRETDLELGELLGYPRCCVEAYVEVPHPRPNPPVLRAALARTRGRAHPRLNLLDLGVFHFISFFPCSFRCERAAALAGALASALRPGHGAFVRAIEHTLSAHRLLALEDVQVSMLGRFDGRRVWIERAWPTCRDRHPASRPGPHAVEAAARLAALVEKAGSALVEEGTIFAGERPIARTVDALLVPFGPWSAS